MNALCIVIAALISLEGSAYKQTTGPSVPGIEFVYVDASLNTNQRNGLVRAAKIWESQLNLKVPIRIAAKGTFSTVTVTDPVTGISSPIPDYGFGMQVNLTTEYANNVSFPVLDAAYAPSLASQFAGIYMAPNYDFHKFGATNVQANLEVNLNYAILDPSGVKPSWYYGVDPALCPPNKTDYTSVALHEIGHALGFASRVSIFDGSHTGQGGHRETDIRIPAIFDYNLIVDTAEPDLMYNSIGTLDAARHQKALNGLVNWNGSLGNYLANALCMYSCYDIDDLYGRIRMANLWLSHTAEAGVDRLMSPVSDNGPSTRSTDFAIGMLGDIGWDIVLEAELVVYPPKYAHVKVAALGDTGTCTFTVYNKGTAPASGYIALKDAHPELSIVSGGGFFIVGIGVTHEVQVQYTASSSGIARDYLVVTPDDLPVIERVVYGQIQPVDSDGDGISDEDETKNLSGGGAKTFWNPFDPNDQDSTGDNSSDTGDGILDGYNDYDGDGYTNALEFYYGSSPVDAAAIPVVEDLDDDGMSDFDENRDLDHQTSGVQNPFSPANSDMDENGILDSNDDYDNDGMTNSQEFLYAPYFNPIESDISSDNGVLVPDTVLDGQNDYDSDGFANMDETRYGHNPLIADSIMDLEWLCCPE